MRKYDNDREVAIIESNLTSRYINLFKECEAFLAGGAISSVFSSARINDYDVYFRSEYYYKKCVEKFALLSDGCKLTFRTDNARSYETKEGLKIQLIKAFYGEPKEILDEFDFTCCMGSYDFVTKRFSLHDNFLLHLSQRRLVFNERTKYPLSSLIRSRKYIQRKGFSIDAIQMVKIALSIHKLDLSNYDKLKEQLMGVDIMLFKQLLNSLEDKKQEPYEFEMFVEWLDQVYNAEE